MPPSSLPMITINPLGQFQKILPITDYSLNSTVRWNKIPLIVSDKLESEYLDLKANSRAVFTNQPAMKTVAADSVADSAAEVNSVEADSVEADSVEADSVEADLAVDLVVAGLIDFDPTEDPSSKNMSKIVEDVKRKINLVCYIIAEPKRRSLCDQLLT